jgi:hypothetical protein
VSPTKLPVPIADVFDSRYEGQLPFSYLHSPDFSFLRRKGEGFEQRGGGFSSGYENSDGMQDGSSGLLEFSSAVDNGELDNGELVSSPHNGIENGELDNGEHVSSPHNGCHFAASRSKLGSAWEEDLPTRPDWGVCQGFYVFPVPISEGFGWLVSIVTISSFEFHVPLNALEGLVLPALGLLALSALALLALVAPVSLRSRDRTFLIFFVLVWSI